MLKIRTKTEGGGGGGAGGCRGSNTNNNDSLGKKAQIKPTNPTGDSTRAKAKNGTGQVLYIDSIQRKTCVLHMND